VNQIAPLVGHEIDAVESALRKLEHEKLMERSRPSQGVYLFRFLAPMDAERHRCLWQLISLLNSRIGRVSSASQLKVDQSESRSEKQLHKF
jgi:hypothetical protein